MENASVYSLEDLFEEEELQAQSELTERQNWQAENDPSVTIRFLPWRERRNLMDDVYAMELRYACARAGLLPRQPSSIDGILCRAKHLIRNLQLEISNDRKSDSWNHTQQNQ